MTKITYLDPKPFLSKGDMLKYHDKIKVFKSFSQKILCIGGSMSLEYELHKWKDINEEEYQKWRLEKHPRFYVGKPMQCTDQDSYMYSFKEQDSDKLDELDKKFIEEQDSDSKLEFYGLHNHTGYHGFFRPDFFELIHMLNTKLPITELDSIKQIYITTEPYPNDNIHHCYDCAKDKHRARTTCYIFNKDKDKECIDDVVQHCDKKQKIVLE